MLFPGVPLSEVTRRLTVVTVFIKFLSRPSGTAPGTQTTIRTTFFTFLRRFSSRARLQYTSTLSCYFSSTLVSCHCGVYKECRIVVLLYDQRWSDNSRPSSATGYGEMAVTQTPHQLNATRPNKRLKGSKRSE